MFLLFIYLFVVIFGFFPSTAFSTVCVIPIAGPTDLWIVVKLGTQYKAATSTSCPAQRSGAV